MKHIQSIGEISSNYDAFILDLWGVIHDGKIAYDGAVECLQNLKGAGKNLILLSNAPRRASVVVEAMEGMGIARSLYDAVITSGEAAYGFLKNPYTSVFMPTSKNYIYLGLEKDRQIIKDLEFAEVEKASEAAFALVSHSTYDNQPMEEITPFLNGCSVNNMTMICVNPDLEVVRQTGERVACAGLIAAEYERMGGKVIYFGKPHSLVYQACFDLLKTIPKNKILAVGDSPRTDIAGANAVGIDCAIVTGGVLAHEVGSMAGSDYVKNTQRILSDANVSAKYVLERFVW
jgi:HAD superfamily hydrolase (TIGR01459 family)